MLKIWKQPTKPYLCNKLEIGLSIFVWKPYSFPWKPDNINSSIMVFIFWAYKYSK